MLPLAAWIMVINLLWNLFDVVDRYMIVHLMPGSAAEALAEVGNYRSSRVLPLLLSSITVMIAGALLPHLSHDWEAGRRQRVSDRLNLFLKIWAILLTAGAAAVLFVAPELFRVGFQSKFAGGLAGPALDVDLLHVVRTEHALADLPVVRRTGKRGQHRRLPGRGWSTWP